MKKVLRIDSNGFFIGDVIIQDGEAIPADCIETQCPGGFYKPKWDGAKWVEGATQEEINNITNIVQTPSIEQRISSIESAISTLMGV